MAGHRDKPRGPVGSSGDQSGQTPDGVVEAQAFLLRDAAGKLRGSFALDELDQPVLAMYDEAETARLGLMVQDDGTATIDLLDLSGEPGVAVVHSAAGQGLAVSNAAGETQLFIGLADGDPALQLSGPDGTVRLVAAVSDGDAEVAVLGADGGERVAVSVQEDGLASISVGQMGDGPGVLLQAIDGTATLQLLDGAGDVRLLLIFDQESGTANLSLFDGQGTAVLGAGTNPASTSISMGDEAGTTRLQAALDHQGTAAAVLYDGHGQPMMGGGAQADGTALATGDLPPADLEA